MDLLFSPRKKKLASFFFIFKKKQGRTIIFFSGCIFTLIYRVIRSNNKFAQATEKIGKRVYTLHPNYLGRIYQKRYQLINIDGLKDTNYNTPSGRREY